MEESSPTSSARCSPAALFQDDGDRERQGIHDVRMTRIPSGCGAPFDNLVFADFAVSDTIFFDDFDDFPQAGSFARRQRIEAGQPRRGSGSSVRLPSIESPDGSPVGAEC